MKKLIWILLIIIILVTSISVYAEIPYMCLYKSFEDDMTGWTCDINGGSCGQLNGRVELNGIGAQGVYMNLFNDTGWAQEEFIWKALVKYTRTQNQNYFGILSRGDTGYANNYRYSITDFSGSNDNYLLDGTTTIATHAGFPAVDISGVWEWWQFEYNGTHARFKIWENGTTEPTAWNFTDVDAAITETGNLVGFRLETGGGNNGEAIVYIKEFWRNCTEPPSTPPVISNVVCTSPEPDDSSEPYFTGGDITPTFTLDTDIASTCYISTTNTSGSWTTFTTTGSTAHTGSLPTTDAINTGNDTVYINCTNTVDISSYSTLDVYTSFVRGRVLHTNGSIIAGAIVTAKLNGTNNVTMVANGTTNSTGWYMIPLPNQSFIIEAYHPELDANPSGRKVTVPLK